MVLTTLSFLARFGVLSSSVIVLGLGVTFIQNRASNAEFLIYIEVLSALTILGSMVPPYPNFVYDLVWTLAWTVAAAFALIVQVRYAISLLLSDLVVNTGSILFSLLVLRIRLLWIPIRWQDWLCHLQSFHCICIFMHACMADKRTFCKRDHFPVLLYRLVFSYFK